MRPQWRRKFLSCLTISIVMGFYSLVGMSQVMTNVTGDAVVTTIVAKWEKAIDLDRFDK